MSALITTLETYPEIFLPIVGIFSLLIGSFLNVVIFRLPENLQRSWRRQCYEFLELEIPTNDLIAKSRVSSLWDLLNIRSHCLSCSKPIRPYDNIPLLSYLFLRGKCRDCHKHISAQYPLVEALSAILCMLVAYKYGVSWQTVAGCLLTYVLIVQSAIDYRHTIIPDEITLPMIWVGLLLNMQEMFVSINNAIIGAVAGYLFLWTVYWLFYLTTKKEGMGFGDFKLLAMLGAWFGWQVLPFIVLFSSLIGSVCGVILIMLKRSKRDKPIPFGPFLAIAGWIAMIAGTEINSWYQDFMGIY